MKAIEQMQISPEIVRQHGLSEEEYALVVEAMGREPNLVELGLFSVMWSEHCAYKNSRALLKRLPTKGKRVVQGPGENAGIVALNEEWAVCFKIESHNHPSAVEPYQGAATGVGGILRDIFTMGARPVALLNSLRFGNPKEKRTRFLLEGVVAGIADYGNCVGVPTVGGEIQFGDGWTENVLVNVMAVGIVRRDGIVRGRAEGEGNLVVYFGNATGRDGIHGATFASEELSENSKAKRPCVQVADPFMEKKFLEATLELIDRSLVVGGQDMGAAGLTCSSSEMAARAGTGMELDLDAVPQRADDMSAYEIMLSESQERMLAVVRPKDLRAVREALERWEVGCHVIGKVAGDGMLRIRHRGEVAGEVSVHELCDEAPTYRRKGELPKPPPRGPARSEQPRLSIEEGLLELLARPTLASKRWVYRQFDHQVQVNTVVKPGADAAVLRVKETGQLIALTVDGCSVESRDWKACGALAVAEAARNLTAVGAEPVGVTNCLNFGNPTD
ncbi:MAG: phosphoribosylformylglycinamidine synthase subunit PurL, partial [bacterium]